MAATLTGADTEELRGAAQTCRDVKEVVDGVIAFVQALILLLKAAAFFTGGASAKYAMFLEKSVLPWLKVVSQGLGMFAGVLGGHADAQDEISDGRTVDTGQLPRYESPALPPSVTVSPDVDVTVVFGGTPAAQPTTSAPAGAPAQTPTAPGGTVPGAPRTEELVAQGGPTPGAPVGGAIAAGGLNGGLEGSTGGAAGTPGTPGATTPGGSLGGGSLGRPLDGTAGDPAGTAGSGTGAPGTTPHSGLGGGTPGADPTTGSASGSEGGAATAPVRDAAGGSLGAAAGIGAGAAALGLGGAALAQRGQGAGTGTDAIEQLTATHGRGSKGPEVSDLQERLTAAGYDTGGVDGAWGSRTEAAYREWRADNPFEIRHGSGFTSPGGFDYREITGVRDNPHVTPEFLRTMEGVAQRTGADPEHLMAVMSFESGGTFDPAKLNGAGSGARGLIQLMPETAVGLGTTDAALSRMSATEQLTYVERYLQQHRGHVSTVEGLYTSVLAGHPKDPDAVVWTSGDREWRQNAGLDTNGDGRITVAEASGRIRDRLVGR